MLELRVYKRWRQRRELQKNLKAFQAEETICNKARRQEKMALWGISQKGQCGASEESTEEITATTTFGDYVAPALLVLVRSVKGFEFLLKTRGDHREVFFRKVLFSYLHCRKIPLAAQLKIDWKRAWLEEGKPIRR